jgi:hypothetical protein
VEKKFSEKFKMVAATKKIDFNHHFGFFGNLFFINLASSLHQSDAKIRLKKY